jgi:hypothetical protein
MHKHTLVGFLLVIVVGAFGQDCEDNNDCNDILHVFLFAFFFFLILIDVEMFALTILAMCLHMNALLHQLLTV